MMGSLHALNFPRTPQVFTPQVCRVLGEANRLLRELRSAGVRVVSLSLDGVRYGMPAELVTDRKTTRIENSFVHITYSLPVPLERICLSPEASAKLMSEFAEKQSVLIKETQ